MNIMSLDSQPDGLGNNWWANWAACEQPGYVIDENFIVSPEDILRSPIDTYRRRKAAREICNLCPFFEECEQNAKSFKGEEHGQYGRIYAGRISVLLPLVGVVRL